MVLGQHNSRGTLHRVARVWSYSDFVSWFQSWLRVTCSLIVVVLLSALADIQETSGFLNIVSGL